MRNTPEQGNNKHMQKGDIYIGLSLSLFLLPAISKRRRTSQLPIPIDDLEARDGGEGKQAGDEDTQAGKHVAKCYVEGTTLLWWRDCHCCVVQASTEEEGEEEEIDCSTGSSCGAFCC